MIDCINTKSYSIDNSNINIIGINELNDDLRQIIDRYICGIWHGVNRNSNLAVVKLEIAKFLQTKSDEIRRGAIAEFFIHLYLNVSGYQQECLFKNLEERSIKKGFDGYYTYKNEDWIMESKSTILEHNAFHKTKVKEAYEDLKGKIEHKSDCNNPWENACSHASSIYINSSKSLRNRLEKFSQEYTLGTYHKISEFNIIPCSTIFFWKEWSEETVENIKDDILEQIKDFNYNKIIVLCINHSTEELFLEYLRG